MCDYTVDMLARDLIDLVDRPLTDQKSLREWYDLAYVVEEKMYESNLHDIIPEFVIHYLSDADVRLKDPDYCKSQNGEIRRILKLWVEKEPE